MRVNWFGLVSLAAVLMVAGGCSDNAGGEEKSSKPPEVGVVTLQARSVELFTELPGRTSPYRVAEVRPQVDGIVQKRAFKGGAQVESGQTLYRIDPKPYRAEFESAKADLAQARAAVRSVAQRAERYADLVDSKAVSQQEYDDVKSELAQKRAQVKVAEAAVQSARINLDYSTIESPIDGRIGRSFITEGALVTANQSRAMAQVTQLDPIYVDISRSSDEVLRLKRAFEQGELKKAGPGQAKVTLRLETGREYAHDGKLQFSDVTVSPDTGSVTLRAKFPNPDRDLLPGMFVRARLSEGVKQNALLVPQQGVSHNRKGEPTALVVQDNNKLNRRTLETDRAIGSFWLVTDGLEAGDRVVVSGHQGAETGKKVRTVDAEIPNEPGDERDEGAKDEAGPSGRVAPGKSPDSDKADQQGAGNDG